MRCDNNFCIFQEQGKCILSKISVDELGMCSECTYPEIDEKILTEAKLKLLNGYQNDDDI